jgi:predicted  nucleic acid-binding Zn-ribbon protein
VPGIENQLIITIMFVIYRVSVQSQIESLQSEFQTACVRSNEEKSVRVRVESRIQSLETELQARTDDLALLQSQADDYRSLAVQRTEQVRARRFFFLISQFI